MVTQTNIHQLKVLVSRYIHKLESILLAVIFILCMSFFAANDTAKADVFGCFVGAGEPAAATCNTLPALTSSTDGSLCVQGEDWFKQVSPDTNDITVLSIHGGYIEEWTSDISAKLRDLYGWNRYNFDGKIKLKNTSCQNLNDKYPANPKCEPGKSDNTKSGYDFCVLHIRSSRFDDPAAINLVKNNSRAVSIHGCGASCTPQIEVIEDGQPKWKPNPALIGKSNTICIGGKNLSTRNLVRKYINQYKNLISNPPLTFADTEPLGSQIDTADTGAFCEPDILGTDQNNIVNKTSKKEGLQLEISRDIRIELAYDKIGEDLTRTLNNDLLRTIVYGGTAKGVGELPLPILSTNGTEVYETPKGKFKRYKLKVVNKIEYPDTLFVASPNLPPCGLNNSASRTWVKIYNASNDQYIYGFCALGKANDLDLIWFAVQEGNVPPSAVYITLQDRQNNRIYRSNRVKITP